MNMKQVPIWTDVARLCWKFPGPRISILFLFYFLQIAILQRKDNTVFTDRESRVVGPGSSRDTAPIAVNDSDGDRSTRPAWSGTASWRTTNDLLKDLHQIHSSFGERTNPFSNVNISPRPQCPLINQLVGLLSLMAVTLLPKYCAYEPRSMSRVLHSPRTWWRNTTSGTTTEPFDFQEQNIWHLYGSPLEILALFAGFWPIPVWFVLEFYDEWTIPPKQYFCPLISTSTTRTLTIYYQCIQLFKLPCLQRQPRPFSGSR